VARRLSVPERREFRVAASGEAFLGEAFLIDVIEGATMKALRMIFSVLMLSSVLTPVATSAEVVRAKSPTAQPLAAVERRILSQGNASYLHGAFADAVGMKEANGAISVFQREANIPGGGKLVAVTVGEIRGQQRIVLTTWTETEVRAYLTSSSGVLKKAMRATKDAGIWTPIPAREAEKQFAAEKKYWVSGSDSAPRPASDTPAAR